jgi:uncharacterized protein YjbI with pentapeptide repeats
MTELYNLPNIRELLTNGFNDAELRALCFDLPGFRPVYDQLAQNTGKAEIVAKLMEHAEKTLQLDTLLALAKERNPARYEKHQPYYQGDPIPLLQKQVVDLVHRLATLSSLIPLTREKQYQVALRWVELGRCDSLADFDLGERNLIGVDLKGADLRRAKLTNANLATADLSEVDLRGIDLEWVNLSGANLSNADLRMAKLTRANLTEANLEGVNLTKVDLTDIFAKKVNLSRARLWGTNLYWAKLSKADLSEADLRGAFLEKANLNSVNLNRARYNWHTSWPEGFDPDKAGAIRED